MKSLEGKTLTSIQWDGGGVSFFWEGGSARFVVGADCCSTTWIDSFDGAEDVIGSPVVKVTTLELPDSSGDCGCRNSDYCGSHDCLALYGFRIETETATATLDFRNESNGYYGGWLQEVSA